MNAVRLHALHNKERFLEHRNGAHTQEHLSYLVEELPSTETVPSSTRKLFPNGNGKGNEDGSENPLTHF
jgi:hypothetical protein